MEIFYNILSVIGVAGMVSVGIWVGIIQTKVNRHDIVEDTTKADHDKINIHGEILASVKTDHDILITKLTNHDALLSSVKNDLSTMKEDHNSLVSEVRADHDLLIRLDEKVNLLLQRIDAGKVNVV